MADSSDQILYGDHSRRGLQPVPDDQSDMTGYRVLSKDGTKALVWGLLQEDLWVDNDSLSVGTIFPARELAERLVFANEGTLSPVKFSYGVATYGESSLGKTFLYSKVTQQHS